MALAVAITLHLLAGAWLLRSAEALIEDAPAIDVRLVPLDALRPKPQPAAPPERRRTENRQAVHQATAASATTDAVPIAGGGDPGPAVLAPAEAPRLRLRPLDCLADPATLSPAERDRCARQADREFAGTPMIASSRRKQAELDAAGERQDQIRRYRATINDPYPGINCWFRGKCGPPP